MICISSHEICHTFSARIDIITIPLPKISNLLFVAIL